MCYHAEFGRSALKGVGINTGGKTKLGSPRTLLRWEAWEAWLTPKTSALPVLPRQIW